MKSFFKKLAFVMALAMVVTLAAPAGSALAAEAGVSLQGTKTIVTAYELNEVGATVDFSFQGAPSDWKTTYKWTSSDEAVATVDKAGLVTAVAEGTATITITAGADASYSHAVVVTVKEPVKAVDFEIEQIDTVTAKLTFNEVADLSNATVDDFTVTAVDEMFEYTLFANTVAVKDNVATLTFVEGVLSDGAIIKIGYAGVEKALVASNGEVNSVVVSYGMNKNYTGDAYVYTELDPDYVLLGYKLYDAKGIDVTANYEENVDYTIEWALTNGGDYASEPEEDSENGWQMSFDAKGAATVKATVIFTDEDGEERYVESLPTTIIAKDRPVIAFQFEEAGLEDMMGSKANVQNVITQFNNWWGSVWGNDMYSSSIVKGKTAWFGARLTDNRGDGLVTTQLTFDADAYADGNKVSLFAKGSTVYGDYGYFVYESSNEDVLDISDDGFVSAVEVGSATILVSFVRYTEDNEELAPVKVCSKRITVTTDYPEPYAKTFKFDGDISLTSTGASVGGNVYVRFYDQYGRNYAFEDVSEVNEGLEISVPSTYEEAGLNFTWSECGSWTGWETRYGAWVSGDVLMSIIDDDIKDNSYSTFKFTATPDKDVDAFSKIVTKNDKVSVKVYNVDKYFAKLSAAYDVDNMVTTASASALNMDFTKWNWSVWNQWSTWIDTYTDKRSEFDANSTSATPSTTFGVEIYSNAGLKLMDLPDAYFIELWDKAENINKDEKERAKLIEGAVYYTWSVPSKAENYDVSVVDVYTEVEKDVWVDTNVDNLTFTFNTIDGKEVKAATTGDYTLTMYYVNGKDKLVKLTSKPITVVNNTPAVKAEGFYSNNVYDGSVIRQGDDDAVIAALGKMYNFTWNGESMYNTTWNYFSSNFEIADVEYTAYDDKLVVTKVTFKTDYFNDCKKITEDNPDTDAIEAGTVNNEGSGYYQTYTLKKRITIKYED